MLWFSSGVGRSLGVEGKYLVYRLCAEEGLTLKRMKPAGKRKAVGLCEERLKATGPD